MASGSALFKALEEQNLFLQAGTASLYGSYYKFIHSKDGSDQFRYFMATQKDQNKILAFFNL